MAVVGVLACVAGYLIITSLSAGGGGADGSVTKTHGDGSASNEESSLVGEVRQAVLMARAVGGPQAMTVRQSLELATLGGARLIGRSDELGSLEAGKLADLALWRIDGLALAGIADPVAALALGSRPPLDLLLVNGKVVVERDEVATVDETAVARAAATRR